MRRNKASADVWEQVYAKVKKQRVSLCFQKLLPNVTDGSLPTARANSPMGNLTTWCRAQDTMPPLEGIGQTPYPLPHPQVCPTDPPNSVPLAFSQLLEVAILLPL